MKRILFRLCCYADQTWVIKEMSEHESSRES